MAVKAPFRFARISRWVHTPAWGPLATHDIPFADGVSGTASLTLTAITPLLIGGERTEMQGNEPAEVDPYRISGKYAIPPSTMQGLCRSILEIAAFGRLGPFVEDRKFGIRDLSGTETARVHYQSRLSHPSGDAVIPNSLAGWLLKRGKSAVIVPCKLSRIHVDDVMSLLNQKLESANKDLDNGTPFRLHGKADDRYKRFLRDLGDKTNLDAKFKIDEAEPHLHQQHTGNPVRIEYSRCVPATGPDTEDGTIVLTGKPPYRRGQDPMDGGLKKREFVFYDPHRATVSKDAQSLELDSKTWDAFCFLHGEKPYDKLPGKKINPNWAYWKSEFDGGNPIPVFYWTKKDNSLDILDTFGMAYAFKAAHTNSTHDLLRNSSPDHAQPVREEPSNHAQPVKEEPLDLPHLIFGVAAEGDGGRGLKRRAWFGMGISDSEEEPAGLGAAILLGPKPSYAGIYVRQQGNGGRISPGEPFATYSPVPKQSNRQLTYQSPRPHLEDPELAGVKIWPCSHVAPTTLTLPRLQGQQAAATKVQNHLHAAPHGTTFTIPLTFHNLRPVELGALLWSLSYGDDSAFGEGGPRLHHRLGMGKAFGLGEVAINVDLKVDGDARTAKATDFIACFEKHMQEVYQDWDGNSWQDSKQVQALRKAADPTQNVALPAGANPYMVLGTHRDNDRTYLGEKNCGGFLPDYVSGHEMPRNSAPEPPPPPPPGPAPEPVVGARIKLKSGNHRDGKGSITKVEGEDPHFNYTIKLDNGVILKARATTFDVIAPPGEG